MGYPWMNLNLRTGVVRDSVIMPGKIEPTLDKKRAEIMKFNEKHVNLVD